MKILALAVFGCIATMGADIRLGIIGTDTSHVIVFTQMFNDPANKDHVAGARVVAAYKGGSPDIDSSWSRVDKYAHELRTKWGLEMEPDIPALCRKVDAILLERFARGGPPLGIGCRTPSLGASLSQEACRSREARKCEAPQGAPGVGRATARSKGGH